MRLICIQYDDDAQVIDNTTILPLHIMTVSHPIPHLPIHIHLVSANHQRVVADVGSSRLQTGLRWRDGCHSYSQRSVPLPVDVLDHDLQQPAENSVCVCVCVCVCACVCACVCVGTTV